MFLAIFRRFDHVYGKASVCVLTSLIDERKLKFCRQSPANNFVLICTSLCLFVSLSLVSPEGDVSSYQTLHRTGKPKGSARRRVIFFFSAKTVNKLDGCLQVYTQQSVEDNTAHEWQWSYRIQIHTRKHAWEFVKSRSILQENKSGDAVFSLL